MTAVQKFLPSFFQKACEQLPRKNIIMNNFEKSVKTLEFNKITAMLIECCATEGARKKAALLFPCQIPEVVRSKQRRTTDAKKLLTAKGYPPFGSVPDVTDSMGRAGKGSTLTMRELLQIADVLASARKMHSYFFADREFISENVLSGDFSSLVCNAELEKRITSAIISEDTMADEASPLLADIRRKIKSENAKIRENLSKYAGGSLGKYLQENIVTIRNGRYVVPVKSEFKNEVKGLVHDTSSSGATYFVEPLAIVESNNELRALQSKEEHEIDRILSELTSLCCNYESAICGDYETLTDLALVFGMAELSVRMKGNEPTLSENRTLKFIRARHPLLDKNKVVPTSIELGASYDTMIITGPNTGGKTVTLKTLGLLSIMAQSGLHIPADEGSVACVFEDVLADIGDEQSIEQSLSTFSAHMVNTVDIMNRANEKCLCLFDELGAGTDPTEGAALAAAIIERIRETGALCAATTHYAEIKAYALETEGVTNASCEFDVETLRPTYRLIVGTPGKSNAFAISRKLGLDESVIDRAKARLTADDLKFENLLQKLETTRREAEIAKSEAEKARRDAADILKKAKAQAESDRLKGERELEINREKAARILESAKATEEYVLNSLDKIRKEQEKSSFGSAIEKGRADMRKRLREESDRVNPVEDDDNSGYVLPRTLKTGDTVLVTNLKKQGTVEKAPDKKGVLTVIIGMMSVKTDISHVKLVEEAVTVTDAEKRRSAAAAYQQSVTRNFSPTLDIRGCNGEEGWDLTDKYLDDAIMASVKTVTILHGKGSGALRNAIMAKLKSDRRVKSYRAGLYGEGDNGVTVVELK